MYDRYVISVFLGYVTAYVPEFHPALVKEREKKKTFSQRPNGVKMPPCGRSGSVYN